MSKRGKKSIENETKERTAVWCTFESVGVPQGSVLGPNQLENNLKE